MERSEKCKIIGKFTKVEFEIKKDKLFNATRIFFKEKLPRKEQESVKKCLRNLKLNAVFGEKSVIVR